MSSWSRLCSPHSLFLFQTPITCRSSTLRDPLRTADLVYDIQSSAAVAIKRRLFDLLGVFPFQEARVDGFQVSSLSLIRQSCLACGVILQ